jgi:outer membrane protein OmpA-like peptidoglycan-associated protein
LLKISLGKLYMEKKVGMSALLLTILLLVSCSYNPLSGNNHATGSPIGAISGAAIGGGGVALLGGTKPLIGAAALAGGAIGYYVTTLRYDSGGVIQSGGQVYSVGQVVGIYIPTAKLFEPNTADMLPEAESILDSAAAVLARYPDNNILVSGNTSGFGHSRWEQKLSERRAEKVSAYLWKAGINQFKDLSIDTRQLTYVGYGDYFPVASHVTNSGIRSNSRIQITSYPCTTDLRLTPRQQTMHNYGSSEGEYPANIKSPCTKNSPCYKGEED